MVVGAVGGLLTVVLPLLSIFWYIKETENLLFALFFNLDFYSPIIQAIIVIVLNNMINLEHT